MGKKNLLNAKHMSANPHKQLCTELAARAEGLYTVLKK